MELRTGREKDLYDIRRFERNKAIGTVQGKVSASTQNQTLNAILFFIE